MSPARRRLVLGASSWFGLGYLPRAPGTFGTIGALPLWWAMSVLPLPIFVGSTLALILVAVWVSDEAERLYGRHDVQHIVIDEVVGLLVTAIAVPFQWPEIIAAVVLFRVFDMLKPWPIRWLDRQVSGGFGVVIDDVVAGIVACSVLHVGRFVLGGLL